LRYKCNLYRQYSKHCNGHQTTEYAGGIYHNPKPIFERLQEIGIFVPKSDRYSDFITAFDFESNFENSNLPNSTAKLEYVVKHIPLSVGVASTVSNFNAPVCFVNNENSEELVQHLIAYLEAISDEGFKILKEKFQYVFDQLHTSENIKSKKLEEEFKSYLQETIVLTFNGGSYDINLIKPCLIKTLMDKIDFVIRRNNHYLYIKIQTLKFLDIKNYNAFGFSYRKFLIAYKCDQEKFYLPYEWLDSLEKLNYLEIPPHEAFFSTLTQSTISVEGYNLVVTIWNEKKWTSVRNLLIFYNLIDVVPFLQAVEKLLTTYREQGLNLFRQAFSVSGIAKLLMFKQCDSNVFFSLISKKHKDLHNLFRE